MTTIVYTENILAADSRTTQGDNGDHTCRHCGKAGALVKESHTKIHILDSNCLFEGERIIAVGGAGTVADIDRLIAAMKHVEDFGIALNHFYAISYSAKCLQCTLLLVTDTSVFEVLVSNPKKNEDGKYVVNFTKHDREDCAVAIGSGAVAALTAVMVYGETAIVGVNAAAVVDTDTGGTKINYIDFSCKDGLKIESVPFTFIQSKE